MKNAKIILLAGIILLAVFMTLTCQRTIETFELALIKDIGTIDDKSFNQGSWEGLLQYALPNNISHRHYQPPEQSVSSYLNTIDLAVRGGAKIIVTPGFLFSAAIFEAQDRYPDVRFILVDALPMANGVTRVGGNTVALLYAEDQAGFLAGYAAVMDGYRNLGFIGGMAVPNVVRFGYGFVQGAEYAAQQLGLAAGQITINYIYTGNFIASPETQTLAASWYNAGVEVIFACGGALGNSVMAAAEQAGRAVIGVDIDQSDVSVTVITSAMKMLQYSVYSSIAAYYRGEFPGGQTRTFEADNFGVGLPMDTSRFQIFSQAGYDAIFGKLAAGEMNRMVFIAEGGDPFVVPVDIVRVTFIK
ncbi:MAG: BMP family ABC transporter substrate-binding protein [Treponema sp.]|jgi:basic membrane protein A|nr:BMP family ABC transporter substrate-binding protein [Treponema sp.]